jgi:hypothetical protein
MPNLTPTQLLWTLAAASLALAVLAGVGDHRRTRRPDLDRPGWVPWAPIQILAGTAAIVAAVLALRA